VRLLGQKALLVRDFVPALKARAERHTSSALPYNVTCSSSIALRKNIGGAAALHEIKSKPTVITE
jgi:hypothetical protein